MSGSEVELCPMGVFVGHCSRTRLRLALARVADGSSLGMRTAHKWAGAHDTGAARAARVVKMEESLFGRLVLALVEPFNSENSAFPRRQLGRVFLRSRGERT